MADRILVLGYGNVDRQDDGVAWHILDDLAQHFGLPSPDPSGEGFDLAGSEVTREHAGLPRLDLVFALQLTPEMSENLAAYAVVCFVDAHTGNVEQAVNFEELQETYQSSPFTHHLTPQTCLSLAASLYGRSPRGFLMSVRGYEFGFSNELSEATQELAVAASQKLIGWLEQFI